MGMKPLQLLFVAFSLREGFGFAPSLPFGSGNLAGCSRSSPGVHKYPSTLAVAGARGFSAPSGASLEVNIADFGSSSCALHAGWKRSGFNGMVGGGGRLKRGGGAPRRGREVSGARGMVAVEASAAAAATLAALSAWMPDPVVRDVACALGGIIGAVGWLGVWTWLARTGRVDPKVSRKVVHCGSGPLFLLTWPLFSKAYAARFIASVVPATNALRLLRAGTSTGKAGQDSGLVSAISRSGRPEEVLQGPFVYTLVLLASTSAGWLTIPAISAVCQMAAGDGMADLAGRKWGTVKWPWSDSKSVVGTLAFFLASFVTTLGEIAWFHAFGAIAISPQEVAGKVALISALCAIVELIPFQKVFGLLGDDNFSVPIVGAALAYVLLG